MGTLCWVIGHAAMWVALWDANISGRLYAVLCDDSMCMGRVGTRAVHYM